jgi:hypothetical protein
MQRSLWLEEALAGEEDAPPLEGDLLADVCCGLVRGPYARFPPEPVRSVGGRVVRAAVERKARREDEGGQAGWLTTRLAAFAPPVFVPAPRGSSASGR